MTEAIRGIKQAIVADEMLKHKVTSLLRPIKQETKEEIIAKAQKRLDAKGLGGDARQITNWLLNPAHAEDRSIKEMADRLRGQAKAKPVKKAKKVSNAKKGNAKETESQMAA